MLASQAFLDANVKRTPSRSIDKAGQRDRDSEAGAVQVVVRRLTQGFAE